MAFWYAFATCLVIMGFLAAALGDSILAYILDQLIDTIVYTPVRRIQQTTTNNFGPKSSQGRWHFQYEVEW